MVTTTTMTFRFAGRQTRKIYNVSGYISDVANAFVTLELDGTPGTSSLTYWTPPEDCDLIDMAIISGPTVITGLRAFSNGSPTGQQHLIAMHYTSVTSGRPVPGYGFASGKQVQFRQF